MISIIKKIICLLSFCSCVLVHADDAFATNASKYPDLLSETQQSRHSSNLIIVDKKKIPAQHPTLISSALKTLANSLASSPVEGNVTRGILLAAARRGDYLPAISWSLSHNYWNLAQVLIAENSHPTPHWMRLSLALHQHDSAGIAQLLDHSTDLSVGDRLQAQMELGRYHQARNEALRALQNDPWNWQVRRKYVQAVRVSGDYLDLEGVWQNFSGLTLYGPRLRVRVNKNDNFGIMLDADGLRQTAAPISQLEAVPAWSSRERVGLFWRNSRFHAQVQVGEFRALRDNVTAKISAVWRATNNGTFSGNFDLHDRSYQSPGLAVAGMMNRVSLQWTQHRNEWTGDIRGGVVQYQGQDGADVGIDRHVSVAAQWKDALGPWETEIGPFADYHDLNRVSNLHGVIAQALRPNARNSASVLSGSYGDVGMRLQWGVWQPALTLGWTPYLALSIFENTRFGPQYQFDTGVSTPVFGADRLRIGFAQGQGGNGLALNQRIIRVGYRLYF